MGLSCQRRNLPCSANCAKEGKVCHDGLCEFACSSIGFSCGNASTVIDQFRC